MARRPRAAISRREFEQKLRTWANVTEFGLALRGSMILGRKRARSWKQCVRAGLAEANRVKLEEHGG